MQVGIFFKGYALNSQRKWQWRTFFYKFHDGKSFKPHVVMYKVYSHTNNERILTVS